ncbi:hypothetical protein C8R43DRAFT_958873 [Mycena crocata]|nr:hypothetical protein C8R43DRAFT_958873 [Mycena crocata]
MPPQTVTQIRYENIKRCLTVTVATLELLSENCKTPFLDPVSNTTRALLTAAESVKQNKADCTELMEQTHQLLNAIIMLHFEAGANTGEDLPPSLLNNIGKFTEYGSLHDSDVFPFIAPFRPRTLHKTYTFVDTQKERSKIRQIFRQGEISALLRACKAGLQESLASFQSQEVNLFKDIAHLEKYAQKRHQEVIELILSLSETESFSLSMLPSEPKIFHGREAEMSHILKHFTEETPRIAILGPGGMGKTTLARTILHHPHITATYQQLRFFVACDAASSKGELAALIGTHLGLNPGRDLSGPIVS